MSKPVSVLRYECSARCGEAFDGLSATERDRLRAAYCELRELAGKWWVGNMRAMQAAGKPVYVLGRLVTSAI